MIWHKKSADDFFTNLNGKGAISFQQSTDMDDITSMISKFKVGDCILRVYGQPVYRDSTTELSQLGGP